MNQITYSQQGAADQLGVSRSFFIEHILPQLAVVRVGRRTLIPRVELEHWVDKNAQSL